MSQAIREAVQLAGVVGAGGAGFPTHVKLQAAVDTVIGNGAECEPLLACDKAAMEHHTALVVRGLKLVQQCVNAERVVLALKAKKPSLVEALRRAAEPAGVELFFLDDVYPAGDEQVLVYEVTGRVVPESGLPLQVGSVVDNVITLLHVARAVDEGAPVTERLLTVAGEVVRPVTVSVPVGTPFSRVLELADGAKVERVAVLEGGPVMGRVVVDLSTPVRKTTSGLIVLAEDHPLVQRKLAPMTREVTIGKSVCCQCRMCTDLCPRFLLGHDIHPHLVMRSMMHSGYVDASSENLTNAYLCCDCGICEIMACPLSLSPRKVNMALKDELTRDHVANPHHRREVTIRPFRNERLIPISRLAARIGLRPYLGVPMTYDPGEYEVSMVRLAMSQHIGAPAVPVVRPGDRLQRGALVGEIPEDKLGARVHASIEGTVVGVSPEEVVIRTGGGEV